MAVYYFKARITYGDTGYYLYKMIQSESLNIESGRAISIISQWIPIILIKLNAPLRIVMIGYSVNFALIYFAGFLIIKYLLKSHFLALGALLCTHLFLHYGYYYPTEMIFSTVYIVAIIAFITYNDRNKLQPVSTIKTYFIGFVLFLIISFIHPFYYIVTGFILLCLYLIEQRRFYLYFFTLSIGLFILKVTFLKSGYEAGKISGINFNVLSWNAIDQSYLTSFWRESFKHHFAVAKFSFFAFVIFLLWKRKWLLAFMLPISYIILYLFVYLSIPNGESLGYMECYVAAISVFPLIIFLVYAEKNLQHYKNLFTIFVFVISLFGLYRIKSEKTYKNRVKYLESILNYGKEHNITKMYMEDNEIKHEKILVGWALPYETLLLSTINGKTQTIYDNSKNLNIDSLNGNTLFLSVPWKQPIYNINLNKKYFSLDSTSYQRINGLDF